MEKFQVYLIEVLCDLIKSRNINHTQFAQAVFESTGHHGRMWRLVRAKEGRNRALTVDELYNASVLLNIPVASIIFQAEEKIKLDKKGK